MKAPLHDVVVVLPGIMGSVLVDAAHRPVWSTTAGVLAGGLLSRGRLVQALQLPAGIGDAHPDDGIVASALIPDLHVIPGIWSVNLGYDHLRKALAERFDLVSLHHASAERPANYVEFAYDWRLSNRYNAEQLKVTVEPVLERFRAVPGQQDAKVVFIAHSMGGLVARYYADVLGGREITRKLVTLGTPHRGALNALDNLVNGVRKGFGPLAVDLTAFARSLPSLHQLLPEYACVESAGGLAKITEVTLPELDTAMVADGMRFHTELEQAAAGAPYDAHPILAYTQPTATTARIGAGRVEPVLTIEGRTEGGDGTVPRLSGRPYGVSGSSAIQRYVMEQHGALPSNPAVHVELGGILSATDLRPRPAPASIGVAAADVLLAGEQLSVRLTADPELLLEVELRGPGDRQLSQRHVTTATGQDAAGQDATVRVDLGVLPPAGYRVVVRPAGGSPLDAVTLPVAVLALDAS